MIESVVEPSAAVDLIPDANLAIAVRETLRLTAITPLTIEVLQDLRTLVAPDRQIVDITGIAHANLISDISPLTHFMSLTTLRMERNPLDEVAMRTHIPALQERGVEVEH